MTKKYEIYLIDDFNSWNKQNKVGGAGDYSSRLKKINREFISTRIVTGVKSSPLELLEKYMTSSPKSGPKLRFIESLLEAISTQINEKLIQLKKINAPNCASFSSERSAFRKYAEFILLNIHAGKFRNDKLSVNENAIIANISQGHILLEPDDLISTFTSRLSTQDRITGDKPFLPLALLGKLLSKHDLRQWAKDEASDVYIHLKDKTVSVSEVLSLDIDTLNCRVTVTLKNQTKHDVYNPPISGSKSIMEIRLIADTDIDHDPEIHTVLQKLNGCLPILNSITEQIHQAKEACGVKSINSKNCDYIYKEVLKNESFVNSIKRKRQDLLNELKSISSNHILQLASSGWNRSAKKQAKKQKQQISCKP